MGAMSLWHWIIVLAVVVLLFGTSRLKSLGKDLGCAIKGFKEGIQDENVSSSELAIHTNKEDLSK